MTTSKAKGWAVHLAISFLVSGFLWAQVDKATISGTVTDQSGAVIVGVSVTVTNVDTGARYTGESNAVGIYRVSGLPVGTYSLEYEKDGFKKLTRSGLALATAQVAEIDVKMVPGAVSEVVQVTAAPVMLEAETTDVGTVMTADAMKDLPLDINASGVGRDITNFIYSNIATTNGGNYDGHIAGSQNVTKNVMVDGVDATAGLQGFIQDIGMEAVQEMNVQISGVSAEGASTGGGTIMLELKSGTPTPGTTITSASRDSGIVSTTGVRVPAGRLGRTTLSFLGRTSVSTTRSSCLRRTRPRLRLQIS